MSISPTWDLAMPLWNPFLGVRIDPFVEPLAGLPSPSPSPVPMLDFDVDSYAAIWLDESVLAPAPVAALAPTFAVAQAVVPDVAAAVYVEPAVAAAVHIAVPVAGPVAGPVAVPVAVPVADEKTPKRAFKFKKDAGGELHCMIQWAEGGEDTLVLFEKVMDVDCVWRDYEKYLSGRFRVRS